MDENRLQSYLNLIQSLLTCPSGEEMELLQQHSELIDSDLIEVMQQVASQMAADGEPNAGFLQQLAQQISQALAAWAQEGNAEGNSAYLPLIQQLLSCPSGEEPQILQDNSQFLDAGFLQACEAVAVTLVQEGEENTANFLRNLASHVGELLEMGEEEDSDNYEGENPEEYSNFILELLQAEESYGGLAGVYPILAQRQHLLNPHFSEILQQVAENFIAQNPDATANIVAIIENLSIDISNFSLGNRANNIEIAITGYQIVLSHRQPGSKKWAGTQNNLATAYYSRIRGEKAENIEKAITSFTATLEVYTRDALSEQWAMTQNNLAVAYWGRIRGEKAENIEKAIASYTAALEVYTRDAFPEDWAMTQNNLANVYSERIRGEKAQNIEQAIASYTAALSVYTREAFPEDWAQTQNNLANAYRDRIRGKKADNIEMAIASYTNALEVRTREAFPEDWAQTQNNLANAYLNKITGEKVQNIELAIASYTNALSVRTRDTFPEQWATTQNNLAIAYANRITGEKADNIELAIECYTNALQVRTRDAFPQDWATTRNNLANAYRDRIRGDKADNIELAIECYTNALQVRTPSAFPLDCLTTGYNLGNLAFELEDWENAIHGYEKAITAVEESRAWAESQRSKRQILENALPIYENLVLASIHLERYHTALLTVERSKSRTLTELLGDATLEPKNATPQQKQILRQLRSQIASFQQQLDSNEPTDTTDNSNQENRSISQLQPSQTATSSLETELKNRQQQLTQLLTEINDPDFTLTEKVIAQLPDFTQFLDNQTALIEWYLPPNPESGFHAFIVTNGIDDKTQIQHLAFTPENRQQLDSDIATYLSDYRQETWSQALSNRLPILAQSLHLNQVLAKLSPTIQKLILIPHGNLYWLPLHALPATRKLANNQNQTGYLLELYPNGVQYIPSQFLHRLHQRQRPQTTKNFPLFAIQNPTEDLEYTEIEVAEISRAFNPHAHILKNREATKIAFNSPENLAKLSLAYYAHFSCHGSFDSKNPLNSALILAKETAATDPLNSALILAKETAATDPQPAPETPENKEKYVTIRDGRRFDTAIQGLTLKEIFATLNLPICRLVTLSACETGLVSSVSTDEYIGLASGFLHAGATNVVSSLWSVSDLSTAFLMIRFYENLKDENLSVSQALQTAQNWLRTINRADFLTWLKNDVKIAENIVKDLRILLRRNFANPPFADPQYWAAFCAIGI